MAISELNGLKDSSMVNKLINYYTNLLYFLSLSKEKKEYKTLLAPKKLGYDDSFVTDHNLTV